MKGFCLDDKIISFSVVRLSAISVILWCIFVHVHCLLLFIFNIRVYDVPESELLKHWDDTYKFIKEVK